jgi:minor extracellular serine protease Vpr
VRVLKVLVLVLLFGTVSVFAQTNPPTQAGNEFGNLWFVELSRAPLADVDATFTVQQRLNYLAQLRADKQAFRNAAAAARIQFRERHSFDVLWNGLSVEVSPAELPRLARIAGVRNLYPVLIFSIPQTQPMSQPELATALAMTGADFAQEELGYTGAGIRVAVMDTGIDYDHPDLGGDGIARTNSNVFPTARVVAGWDFVGDSFNADPTSPTYHPTAVADPYPDDCNGHGTHVAGIVGAGGDPLSGGARGVAPEVWFGAYRVFGCAGSTTADIMIAAMERALADGMQILNMSIGSAFQWPQYPTAQASDRLVNKGVVVVASIGNSGANGLYSTGAPGNGTKVIGVASFDNSHVQLATFIVTPANITAGYGNAAGAPPAPTSGSLPMAKSGTPTSAADACRVGGASPFNPGQFSGMAVLIRRGTCTFHEKALNAQNAGAAAVVLYNNAAGRFSPTVAGTPAITIPVVAIADTEGVAINNAIASGPQTLTWTAALGTFLNPTGGLISSFSSYGLSPDLALKPDIGAPGGLIRSTYPLEAGGYATISGTSMSSPHVAGGVALLLQAHPRTPAQAVRDILQNSADPKLWWGNPALGFLDNVHRQGAGMLDIDDAIVATTRVQPGKLALGESQSGPATRTLTIVNDSSTPVTYTLSHAPALSTGPNTFTPAFSTGFASVAFSASSITVPARGSATVDVTITASPTLPDRSQYGGYIVLTPQGGGPVYRVPYAGFKGDYQSIVALAPTTFNFPWLAKLVGTAFVNQPSGATYTLAGGDVPYFLVHLDHQVRRLRAEVFDTSGRAFHRAFEFQYVGRNSTATSFFAIAWDGKTTQGRQVSDVPNGSYTVVLSVQKALGDDDNPAHWESWTSPVITIARPSP